jgi:hypothetical protein
MYVFVDLLFSISRGTCTWRMGSRAAAKQLPEKGLQEDEVPEGRNRTEFWWKFWRDECVRGHVWPSKSDSDEGTEHRHTIYSLLNASVRRWAEE